MNNRRNKSSSSSINTSTNSIVVVVTLSPTAAASAAAASPPASPTTSMRRGVICPAVQVEAPTLSRDSAKRGGGCGAARTPRSSSRNSEAGSGSGGMPSWPATAASTSAS